MFFHVMICFILLYVEDLACILTFFVICSHENLHVILLPVVAVTSASDGVTGEPDDVQEKLQGKRSYSDTWRKISTM